MTLVGEVYRALKSDMQAQAKQLQQITLSTQRSETAGGVRSFTLANAPVAATGGMSNGSQFLDLIFISNGRKSGEAAGAGTGQLCYYDSSVDTYRCVRDDSIVTV